MTAFLKATGAVEGDVLIFEKNNEDYFIKIKKKAENYFEEDGVVTLVLDNSWRVINY